MKKWISILLAVVMVFSLFPVGVLAADGADDGSNVNPSTGREPGPKGSEDVAVMVYGKSMADAVMKASYDFSDFVAALKSELKGILANEKLPEVEMYLVDGQNREYKLTEGAVEDAAFLSSFRMKSGGVLGWLDDVFKWLQDGFGWLISGVDTIGEFYKIYGAEDVPEGDYTLEVRKINGDGYTLWEPRHGTERVHVGDDHVNYVGFEKYLGGHTFEFSFLWWDVEVYSIDFYMPGVFMDTREPGFGFQSVNCGAKPVPGAEFVLVNREETENILRAAFALGKDTFTNAMNLIGTEGFTWEELSILNSEIYKWDSEAQQITFDKKAAWKLVSTYWALVEASALDPMIDFMSDETDIRLPAILQATADENGYVFFGEDNNVTLIWSMEILFKMGDIVLTEIDDIDLLDGVFSNPQTEAIVNLVLTLAKYGVEKGADFVHDNSGFINDWVYPLLQNDNIMKYAGEFLEWLIGDDLTPEQQKMLQLLPRHALLTAKMPAGHYIMFETAAPKGYFRSPLFYTMNLIWNTEVQDPAKWCYVTFGNLGVIGPYLFEDYYSWLREFDYAAEADALLNEFTDGAFGTVLEDLMSSDKDMTAIAIAYFSDLLYNQLGGDQIFASQLELTEGMMKYFYAYGRTMQNMFRFGNEVIRTARSVVTDEITPDWKFYNISTSLRTNIALKVQAMLEGTSEAIYTEDGNEFSASAKEFLDKIIDNIDTSNHIEEPMDQLQNQFREMLKNNISKIMKNIIKSIFQTLKEILSWRN